MRMQLDVACESAWCRLNLSAIFGCVLNRCYKGAGRCDGLIESWP